MAETLNQVLADPLYNADIDALSDIAQLVVANSDAQHVQVFRTDGRIIVDTAQGNYPVGKVADEFDQKAIRSQATAFRTEGGIFEVAVPIKVGGDVLASVRFGFDSTAIDPKVRAILLERLWQTAALVLAGVVLSYVVAQHFVRPVRRLVAATKAVSDGDHEFPILEMRNDEIGELSGAFQEMAQRISDRTTELRRINEQLELATDNLEGTVEERTAELRGANRQLQHEIAERKLVQQEYSATSSRLEALVTNLRSGILFEDESRLIQYVNPVFCEMFGAPSPEALIGADCVESSKRAKGLFADADNFVERIQKVVNERVPVIGEELLLADGRIFERDYIPISSESALVGYLWHYRDITDRRRADRALRQSSRLASIGELAAGVAHEINNPVNSIMGFSELLMDEDLPEPVRNDLERIYSDAQRAARIVANLLSFARHREPQMQRVDIATIVDRTLQLKSHDFQISKVKVDSQLPQKRPHVAADPDQMVEVMLNILNNAEHAMANANGGGQLTIRCRISGENLRTSISDDGPGIAGEIHDKIFDPFFTTKNVDEGTGLGLSICYGIMQQHGGNIWADSVPGKRTTLHIELPIDGPQRTSTSAEAQD